MASPVRLYQSELHDQLGFYANWFPADPLDVGWAGTFENGRFRRSASLAELDVAFELEESGSSQDIQCVSSSGVAFNPGVGVGVAAVGAASLTVEFSRQGAFIFHAHAVRRRSLRNTVALAEQLLAAYAAGTWQRSWRLVDGVHVADAATILVSQGSSASLELEAKIDGDLLAAGLADPRVGLTVRRMRGTVFQAVAQQGLTPLYSCLYVKDPWLRTPSVRPVRGDSGDVASVFARPGIDELLDT